MTFVSMRNQKENTKTGDNSENNCSVKQAWPNHDPSGGCGCVAAPEVGGTKQRCPAPISRLRVEKIEGGLMVAGVVVAANCQIILPIFGFLFLLVGCVLTAVSYRGRGEGEEADHYAARLAFSGQSRVLGPTCVVGGALMLAAGAALCALTRRARKQGEHTVGFHCPLHGDFYPLSPGSKTIGFTQQRKRSWWPLKTWGPGCGTVAVGPPQCPHSQVSSAHSSLASSPHSHCPTPLPFLVNPAAVGCNGAGSPAAVGVVSSVGLQPPPHSPGDNTTFREVASFPLSRTPTPPPGNTFDGAHNLVNIPDEERLVDSHFESVPVHREGPRKSVSIVLPTDEVAG